MRILQVLPTLRKNSGVTSVVMNLYRHVDRSIIHFDFLLFSHEVDSCEQEVIDGGSQIFVIPKPNLTTFGNYKKAVNDFFVKHGSDYDIVHCHDIVVGKYIGRAAKKTNSKFILHAHNTKFSEKILRDIRNRILFIGAKKYADYFLGCSYIAGKAMFGKKIANSDNFSVLLNGIDFACYRFDNEKRLVIKSQYDIPDDAVVLGCLGRLSTQKNCMFSLSVFNEYHKINNNSYLLFVGDGQEKERIKELAKKMGISEYVIITGVQSDVGAFLSAMDFFLFPSLFEGLGLALVEAQANGLNCISSINVPKEACVCNCKRLSTKTVAEWVSNIQPTETVDRDKLRDELQIYSVTKFTNDLMSVYEEVVK